MKREMNLGWLIGWLVAGVVLLCGARASAVVQVYAQTPHASGGLYKSAWFPPDGLDSDEWVWDNFMIPAGAAITEIRWRGAYGSEALGFPHAPASDFTIAIYRNTPNLVQPDLQAGGRLVRYYAGDNAGETGAGLSNGVPVYDYHFTLPVPFQAAPGTIYWVQIIAHQGIAPQTSWPPDWSMVRGSGGNNAHFRRVYAQYQNITGDCVFSLYTSGDPTVTISASAAPLNAGVVTGAGAYPVNSTATLTANPAAGYGFARWTEGGVVVSTANPYAFAAAASRTLVANFVPAFDVVTAGLPSYGGVVTGGGRYNEGTVATLTATPHDGFVFTGWSDGATEAVHPITVMAGVYVTAYFDSAPGWVTFNLDNAPVHTSLPVAVGVDGLGMGLSATGGGFSIQPAGTVGINPPGFSGLILYPNSVFGADLIADFSALLTRFSILYSPQEIGCDDSATMRVTVYRDGVQVGTATTTCPTPGTYPSHTLAIDSVEPFDRAVVHYDSRPPRCQDYGVIFLADNITVRRACAAPGVTVQPVDVVGCVGATAEFGVVAAGDGTLAYRWQREGEPGVWADVNDGVMDGVGVVEGSGTATLLVRDVARTAHGAFRCGVVGSCGETVSNPAWLILCVGDYDCSGGVDGDDVIAFCADWDAGLSAADVDGSGGVDGDDVIAFFGAWDGGC